MSRRRVKPLPPGIYERALANGQRVYWIDFRDAAGARVRERAGTSLEGAVRQRAQRLAEIARGTFDRATGSSSQTLETYAGRWNDLRRKEGVRTADREAQLLRDYVMPTLGNVPLAELRPRHVAELVRALVIANHLSAKSIRNVHGALSALLARARFDELIIDNPARGLPRGVLPDGRRTREVGAWTRDELARWISPHPDVPEERTIAYAIAAFTGARVGEIAGLRWRDLDTEAKPLWRWALRTQYDGEKLKTDNPRDVPIHHELQRILAAWKIGGWARFMLRHARPDDFVVPRNPELRTGRPQHSKEEHHSSSSLGAKAVRRHAAALNINDEGRDFHSFRRAFVTLARTDGAPVQLVERITHNARGEMVDVYTYFGWETLCSAVQSLRLAPLPDEAGLATRLATRRISPAGS